MSEKSKLLGVCTVFVYQDGYIVQPAGVGSSTVDHEVCVVLEDASTTDSIGTTHEPWKRLRLAIRAAGSVPDS